MEDASHAARRGALTAPVRRALIGALAGIASSVALLATMFGGAGAGIVLLGALIGAVVALAAPHSSRKATLDGVLTAAVLGVPLWAVINVIVLPVIMTGSPAWTAPGMRAAVPRPCRVDALWKIDPDSTRNCWA